MLHVCSIGSLEGHCGLLSGWMTKVEETLKKGESGIPRTDAAEGIHRTAIWETGRTAVEEYRAFGAEYPKNPATAKTAANPQTAAMVVAFVADDWLEVAPYIISGNKMLYLFEQILHALSDAVRHHLI